MLYKSRLSYLTLPALVTLASLLLSFLVEIIIIAVLIIRLLDIHILLAAFCLLFY